MIRFVEPENDPDIEIVVQTLKVQRRDVSVLGIKMTNAIGNDVCIK